MRALTTLRSRVVLALIASRLMIGAGGNCWRYSCLVAKVFGVQDLVTIAGDNHRALVRLKLTRQPLSPVIEMAESGS